VRSKFVLESPGDAAAAGLIEPAGAPAVEMKSMYAAYHEAMLELVRQDEEIVLLYGDFPKGAAGEFLQKSESARLVDVGIAEANLITTASGMAAAGKKPFTHCHSIFAIGRAYNQIRQNVAFDNLNVKIVLCNSGLLFPFMGGSHQVIEEIAAIRVIPNMMLVSPADPVTTRKATRALAAHPGPAALRLAHPPVPSIYTEEVPFDLGKAVTVVEGEDVTVIATGITVAEALVATDMLLKRRIKARLLDMHTIKPLDEPAVRRAAEETGAIVTVEDSSIVGGLGGAVAEYTAEHCPVPVRRVGVKDAFGQSATVDELKKAYEIAAENIVAAVESITERKQRISR
jgi:transketolase